VSPVNEFAPSEIHEAAMREMGWEFQLPAISSFLEPLFSTLSLQAALPQLSDELACRRAVQGKPRPDSQFSVTELHPFATGVGSRGWRPQLGEELVESQSPRLGRSA
jgi:hypothetical protein